MCSQYTLKTNLKDFADKLDFKIRDDLDFFDRRVLPSMNAPVVVMDKNLKKLTAMRFSLIPSWSKEAKVKFATHNARIETVLEKPTWKIPFESKHCVIPMTGFFESVYEGINAGNIIEFSGPSKNVLCVAGIYDYWKDIEDEKNSFYSFSILTREPSAFISGHGHDRTPIFIGIKDCDRWLCSIAKSGQELKSDLLSYAIHPELIVEIDRALKPGWEKRK